MEYPNIPHRNNAVTMLCSTILPQLDLKSQWTHRRIYLIEQKEGESLEDIVQGERESGRDIVVLTDQQTIADDAGKSFIASNKLSDDVPILGVDPMNPVHHTMFMSILFELLSEFNKLMIHR